MFSVNVPETCELASKKNNCFCNTEEYFLLHSIACTYKLEDIFSRRRIHNGVVYLMWFEVIQPDLAKVFLS